MALPALLRDTLSIPVGGALQYVNHVGVKKFVKRAGELAKKAGPRFAPPKLLRGLAAKNQPLA